MLPYAARPWTMAYCGRDIPEMGKPAIKCNKPPPRSSEPVYAGL